MSKKALMISNMGDLAFAKKTRSDWDLFVPAHHQIQTMLETEKLPIFYPKQVPITSYVGIQNDVASVLEYAERQLCETDPSIKAILLRKIVTIAQRYFFYQLLLTKDSIRLHRTDGRSQIAPYWSGPQILSLKQLKILNIFGIPRNNFIVDFQSPSGRAMNTFQSSDLVKRVSTIDFKSLRSFKGFSFSNISILVTTSTVAEKEALQAGEIFPNRNMESALRPALNRAVTEYQTYRTFWRAAFYKNRPTEGWFNFVKNPRMAAAITALHELNVPVRFQTHGGAHVFGSSAQKKISEILAKAHFNSFPSARYLYPRGRMQETTSDPKQVIFKQNDRLVPEAFSHLKSSHATRLKIAYVPSFIAWEANYWCLANSCFDTFEVAEQLLDLVSDMDIDLRIRLRGNIDTHLKGAKKRTLTGIDVRQLTAQIEKTANVTDASKNSYVELLTWADLIITEGLTAVTYDALDRRKPVLSLRSNASIRGSFPGEHPKNLNLGERHALYSATIDDLTAYDLKLLAKYHYNNPLTNTELRPYLYV